VTSGGKVVQIQSCLSSIPNYNMGSICCKRRFTKKWSLPDQSPFGMVPTLRGNIIWPNGSSWHPLRVLVD
jgi:hypothetical protein